LTAPDSFSIDDQVDTTTARAVQWYLHADHVIEKAGNAFVIPGRRPLTIGIRGPIASSRIEPTTLTAPGQPGSITAGPQGGGACSWCSRRRPRRPRGSRSIFDWKSRSAQRRTPRPVKADITHEVLISPSVRHPSLLIFAVPLLAAVLAAQQPATDAAPVVVKPIDPPANPLPSEEASAGVTKFSFVAYGDSRSGSQPDVPGDGQVLHVEHTRLMDFALAKIDALASTPYPARFVLHSGDAVLRGANPTMWNVSFTPIIERLSRRGGIPFFLAAGNHDVSGMPLGNPGREPGLRNTLAAMSKLMPAEGSRRRLAGYPTYAVGYGNLFAIAIDSNIASDPTQLAWVTEQLDRLDRTRYRHLVAFFHHPVFSSGPHGGPAHLEPPTIAIRESYMPLFRRHHVGLIIAGHDHLFDHWIERYADKDGRRYRIDQVITGGGGAPVYVYGGEPDLREYLTTYASERVTVEHLARPGPTPADNPHHFIVIQVDGDRVSLEVVGSGAKFAPYNGRTRIDLFDRVS